MVCLAGALQNAPQALQFCQSLPFGIGGEDPGQLPQHLPSAATAGYQGFQLLPGLLLAAAQSFQFVGVFPPQTVHGLALDLPRKTAAIENRGNQAHVGQVQHIAPVQQRQALHRQQHHLGHFVLSQVTHALQSSLHNLPVIPIDIFTVVDLLHHPRGLGGVFHNGQGHIRFQGQQLSPRAGKGNNLVRHQKILVAHIQIVLFKMAHLVGGVAVTVIQTPQGKLCPLFTFPDSVRHHSTSPLSSMISVPPDSLRRTAGTGSPG